jgi:hypothetical protein
MTVLLKPGCAAATLDPDETRRSVMESSRREVPYRRSRRRRASYCQGNPWRTLWA